MPANLGVPDFTKLLELLQNCTGKKSNMKQVPLLRILKFEGQLPIIYWTGWSGARDVYTAVLVVLFSAVGLHNLSYCERNCK